VSRNKSSTTYHRPEQPAPGVQSQIDGLPDLEGEKCRKRDLYRRLLEFRNLCRRYIDAIDQVFQLLERGVTLPDISSALGLPPVIPRATRPLNPWKIRSGSNMEIVADMLEAASRRGVSEGEMVTELQRLGRLQGAKDAARAVHWTVKEIQRRTRFIERRTRARGARWYAFGTFSTWRQDRKAKKTSSNCVSEF